MQNNTFAKKSLGQHFLTSTGAVEKIIAAGEVREGDTILEIGPGRGVLTKALLATGANMIAVEKDDSLIPVLTEMFSQEITSGQLNIIHDDILTTDLGFLPSEYKLIANIPYYITGEIMKLFLTAQKKPSVIVVLVQKEVAERIVAKPNGNSVARSTKGGFRAKNGKESILSLSVKLFGTPTYIQTVKRGSFNPPPNVDSAILKIDLRFKNKELRTEDEEKFFEIIKTGFKSKRKKLISNLSPLYEKGALSRAFGKLSLDENIRAEDLNLDQWINLLKLLGLQGI